MFFISFSKTFFYIYGSDYDIWSAVELRNCWATILAWRDRHGLKAASKSSHFGQKEKRQWTRDEPTLVLMMTPETNAVRQPAHVPCQKKKSEKLINR